MAIFRPFVEAVQWTGINVIEIRQFIRANAGYFNDAVIEDGVLYVVTNPADPIAGTARLAVPVNNWLVRSGLEIATMTNQVFLSQYTP